MANYSSLSDKQLLELMAQDKEPAFTEVYNRYWKKLFTIAANKINDLQEAEDIVQQLFVTVWERRRVLEITSSLDSYLAVALKYRILKSLDKAFRKKEFKDDDTLNVILDGLDNSTQEWLEFQEIKTRLAKLIAALPEKCRLIYKLNKDEGYSYKQIADELDISEKTVENQLGKANKIIRAGLKCFFTLL